MPGGCGKSTAATVAKDRLGALVEDLDLFASLIVETLYDLVWVDRLVILIAREAIFKKYHSLCTLAQFTIKKEREWGFV